MGTATRQDVREYLIDHYGLGRRGTNSGIVASSLTDLNFSGQSAAEHIEVGCQVLITSGDRAGDIRQLSSRPQGSTGLMSVSRDFGGVLADGDDFEALYRPFQFDGGGFSLHDRINQALGEFYWERRLVPVTLIPDGDMLAAGVDDWTANGSSIVAKAAGLFPHGQRELRVITTAGIATDYVASASIYVEADESYYLEATARNPSVAAEMKLGLRNWTGGSDIDLDQSEPARGQPQLLVNTAVTMPPSCARVEIRLGSTAMLIAGGFWTNIILRKNSAQEFTIQDREIRILDIGRVFATTVNDWGERGKGMPEVAADVQQLDSGLWQIRTDQSLAGKSVWYEEFVKAAVLSADSDTTTIPKEAVAAVAAEMLLHPVRRDRRWVDRYELAARIAARARMDHASLSVVRMGTQYVYPLVSA